MSAASGSVNMGIDEALATLCRDRATLRFYAWEAPTLSIGYAQRCSGIDLAACRSSMVTLVRRPTGGRAVLHRQDLTYSLILPLRPPWTTCSIAESYRLIHKCLLRGLETFGLNASIGYRSTRADGSLAPFCFPAIARDDIVVDGKKIIGSAQRRFPAALLQQGSILLDFDPASILALLGSDERAAAAGALTTVGSLREVMGRLPYRWEVEAAVCKGLAAGMEVEFAQGELEPEEFDLSMQLAATRYGSQSWTFRF
jgi:lipoate-protein ligase A